MSKSFLLLFFKKEESFFLHYLERVQALALAISVSFASIAMADSPGCPARPLAGGAVSNPFDLVSVGGLLHAGLTIRSQQMAEMPLKVCYVYKSPSGIVESPTLRVAAGDRVDLALTNRLTDSPPALRVPMQSPGPHDPCVGGTLADTSTNLVFDSLALTPDCHEGESVATTIENIDPPFEYHFRIPGDTAPGMYLYHPHRMGSASLQLDGGASGVLIVGGMASAKPEVAGLPERILVFRRQFDEPDATDDVSWISINFQPVGYRHLPPPIIRMKPGTREFWRVANGTSDAFLALQLIYATAAQRLRLVALDGVPTAISEDVKTVDLPPGGRAEFVVAAPAPGQEAQLAQAAFDMGPIGPEMPAQELARIVAEAGAQVPPPIIARGPAPAWTAGSVEALAERHSTTQRRMYFAEAPNGTRGPTRYFLTQAEETPALFDPSASPAMLSHVGALEDWVVANHTGEVHAFHIQGMHFLLLSVNDKRLSNPEMRDTVTVPAWHGEAEYPSVTLRVDFANPRTVGGHVVECNVTRHAEAGMMALVQVRRN